VVKKISVVLVLAALVAGGLSAQVSVGLGGHLGGDFGGGLDASQSALGLTQTSTVKTPYFGGGGYLFFDAKYVEISFGLLAGSGTMEGTGKATYMGTVVAEFSEEIDMSYTSLTIGALGKYPFAINRTLSAFPLLGIDYLIATTVKEKETGVEEDDPGDLSALWFKLGGGLDISLSEQLYLRVGVLYGLRLASKWEKDAVAEMKDAGYDAKPLLGHGLTAKLALGFKF
jgi:opacity protein-like surface antigen